MGGIRGERRWLGEQDVKADIRGAGLGAKRQRNRRETHRSSGAGGQRRPGGGSERAGLRSGAGGFGATRRPAGSRMRSRMLSNRPRSAAFAGEPRAALPARLSLSMFSPSSFPAQRGILATKPGLSLRAAGGAGPAAVPATPRASAGRNRRSPPHPPLRPHIQSHAASPPSPSHRGQAPLCTHSTFSWSAPPQLQASTCCWISPWRCGTGSARGHGGLRGRERGTEGPTSRGGAERCALCCRASGLRSCGAALRLRAAAPAPLRAPSALPPRPPRVGVRGGGR